MLPGVTQQLAKAGISHLEPPLHCGAIVWDDRAQVSLEILDRFLVRQHLEGLRWWSIGISGII